MLECSSEAEASRVLALGRTLYGTSKVFLDRWTVEAGRTTVLKKQDEAWIRVSGIPLHLRSDELFRGIGEKCGGYVEHQEAGCRLNEIRVKVRLSKDRKYPDWITLRFREREFRIHIAMESLAEESKEGGAIIGKGKGVGGEVEVSLRNPLARNPIGTWKVIGRSEVGESSGSRGESEFGTEKCTTGGTLVRRMERDTARHEVVRKESSPIADCFAVSVVEPDVIHDFPGKGAGDWTLAPISRTSLSEGVLVMGQLEGNVLFKGRIASGEKAVAVVRKEFVCPKGRFVGLTIKDGLGLCFVSRAASDRASELLCSTLIPPKFPFTRSWSWAKESVTGPALLGPSLESWNAEISDEGGENLEAFSSPQSHLSEITEEGEFEKDMECEKIVEAASKVASILDLRLKDSVAEALESVKQTAGAVISRRTSVGSKSWSERELKRLGTTIEATIPARTRGQNSGGVSPISLSFDV
ncbi:hypothetical protein LINPERHAP1_LOCUS34509 [Linum perenne]